METPNGVRLVCRPLARNRKACGFAGDPIELSAFAIATSTKRRPWWFVLRHPVAAWRLFMWWGRHSAHGSVDIVRTYGNGEIVDRYHPRKGLRLHRVSGGLKADIVRNPADYRNPWLN